MKFLVPYDFTEITRIALDHALAIAPAFDAEVLLYHVIDDESERAEAEQKFKDLLKVLNGDNTDVQSKVQLGKIFKDISREAEEGDAHLLIMGTHGAHGLQKIFGSHAIKVIKSASTPFMITQNKGPAESIKQIMMPVNLTRESVQIVKYAAELAQKFEARIHMLCQPETDEFLERQLKNNIARARKYLTKEGVASEVDMLPGKKSLSQEVIEYGHAHQADLFAVVHYSESLIPQFDTFSQDMITNEYGIPVLIMNGNEMKGIKLKYSFISI